MEGEIAGTKTVLLAAQINLTYKKLDYILLEEGGGDGFRNV